MGATSKQRTPSRARCWERERRNKFNKAISELGEVIRTANKENQSDVSSNFNQFAKIDIIQKAILLVKDHSQEKLRLKSEILALQVKLDNNIKQKEKKDVSTQITKIIQRKIKNPNVNKLKKNCNVLKVNSHSAACAIKKPIIFPNIRTTTVNPVDTTIQTETISNVKVFTIVPNILACNAKGRQNTLKKTLTTKKSKCVKTVPGKSKSNSSVKESKSVSKSDTKEPEKAESDQTMCGQQQNTTVTKQPKILPKTCEVKGQEDTFVVVPGAPYIIPQRPQIFHPTAPTLVLLNPGIQPINKSFPILNRAATDITKTTMVNILPISAYSKPLSATKTKKCNTRHKNEIPKKNLKVKKVEINISSNQEKETDKEPTKLEQNSKNIDHENSCNTGTPLKIPSFSQSIKTSSAELPPSKIKKGIDKKEIQSNKEEKKDPVSTVVACAKLNDEVSSEENSTVEHRKIAENQVKEDKNNVEKGSQQDKTKLSNILESSLCENTVDGGNARLELAEELLAASPTAAFLMSFPLVSGNRADSPAEESQSVVQSMKDNNQRRDITTQPVPFYEKHETNDNKEKANNKNETTSRQDNSQRFINMACNSKQGETKTTNTTSSSNQTEPPYLNLALPSTISTSCTLSESTFALDFDCHVLPKSLPNQSTYNVNNNIFFKSDPLNTVKSAIYSTSSIPSGHDFNSIGLYPCAMEKFSSKTKTDYSNVEDNLMKIGSSRLTYDIDLGWSHKGLDFVNCTTNSSTFSKDNLLNTVPTNYTTSYNPFNPEFHMPLVTTTSKKENSNKPSTSFVDTITSFYSQTSNLWPEEVPFYSNSNINSSKTFTSKQQNYLPLDHSHNTLTSKQSIKQYEKSAAESCNDNTVKSAITQQQHMLENPKYTKKSPSKMHINWMTSETRPMQNLNMHAMPNEIKEQSKVIYGQVPLEHTVKKQDRMQFQENDANYFPINIHNYSSQIAQDEFPVWPMAGSRTTLGTTEISIDPPPINLPTLVGDLALGPHDKKKNAEVMNRGVPQNDLQNCNSFLSVTQLMNRSTDNMPNRCALPTDQSITKHSTKQNVSQYSTENTRKMPIRIDNTIPQPCYTFNESKVLHGFEAMNQYSSSKTKPTKSVDKHSKNLKHSYTAESLIRGGSCTQKHPENKMFSMSSQKYADYNTQQDNSVAQVSHFPPLIDYTDNSYTSQQFSGTTLYNSTTNTISNSFYNNFMPGSTNLMSSNYTGAPFSSEFIDYNQSTECNYSNHKYEEFKIKGHPPFNQDKSNIHKNSRREYSTKHKLECSKKDSTKKYPSKRSKVAAESDDWNESNNLLWQNKAPSTKRQSNLMSEELSFTNYGVSNQVSAQYQPDIFNTHLIPPNVQSMGHNMDRSLTSFPVTSRANFNLSTIFPEIAMVSAP